MFKYNPRILELIKGEPLVISSGLGTGKTQSVKQYVSTTTTRTLVVVNDTDSQEDLLKGVEEYCVSTLLSLETCHK